MAAEQETDPRLRWLKPLVIGLSLLFVALLLAVIVAMVTGVPQRSADAAKSGAKLPSANLMEQSLNLPRNSRVADVFASGERIIIRVRLADGTERLYALHGQTLSPIGMLTMQVER